MLLASSPCLPSGRRPRYHRRQTRTTGATGIQTIRSTMMAEEIARALGGHKAGSSWMARCPAHDDRKPSLTLYDASDGKTLVHCHAGCDQRTVIAALGDRGLWSQTGKRLATDFAKPKRQIARDWPKETARTRAALELWRAAIPAAETPVETYLRSRGLTLKPPISLRFHSGLRHPSGGYWPAMIALVTRGSDDEPLAILRTFLSQHGLGKAPVEPAKMMLGPCGGGAVRLAEPEDRLLVGEGIETCLAAMQATGQPAWAALSTSGLHRLDLPEKVREVIVLADGDEPGEAAAVDCARRWKREGRRVRIARPPPGQDFNDLLMGHRLGLQECRL